jgi:hypothetical protein
MINRTNKSNYLSHAEIAEADNFKKNIKNPELLAFVEESDSHYRKTKNISRTIVLLIIFTIGSFFYWQNQQHLNEVSQQLEITKAEKQKVTTAKSLTEKTLVEANHNYALALNEKAIKANNDGDYEVSKLYALTALSKGKVNSDLTESLKIVSKLGVESYSINHFSGGRLENKLMAVSKNFVAIALTKYIIRIVDLESGRDFVLGAVPEELLDLKLSPSNSNQLFTLSTQGTIYSWNIKNKTSELISKVEVDSNSKLAISSDGTVIALSSENQIHTINITKANLLESYSSKILLIDNQSRIDNETYTFSEKVALSSNGQLVAIVSKYKRKLFIFNRINGHVEEFSSERFFTSAPIFINNNTGLAIGQLKDLMFVDLRTNKATYVREVASTNINQVIAYNQEGKIIVSDIRGGINTVESDQKTKSIISSPARDSNVPTYYFESESVYFQKGAMLHKRQVFPIKTPPFEPLKLSIKMANFITLSHDDRYLAIAKSSHSNKSIKYWVEHIDLITGAIRKLYLDNYRVSQLEYSVDGKTLFGINSQYQIISWNLLSDEKVITKKNENKRGLATNLYERRRLLSKGGKVIAYYDNEHQEIKVINTETQKKYSLDSKYFSYSTLNHDGTSLVASEFRGSTTRFFNLINGQFKDVPYNNKMTKLVFSPDGKLLVGIKNREIVILRPSGEILHSIPLPSGQRTAYKGLTFTPNSKNIAITECKTTQKTCSILIWDLVGNKTNKFSISEDVRFTVFSHKGDFLVTVDAFGSFKLKFLGAQPEKTAELNKRITALVVHNSPDTLKGNVIHSVSSSNKKYRFDILNTGSVELYSSVNSSVIFSKSIKHFGRGYFSPDDKFLIFTSKKKSDDSIVTLINLEDHDNVRQVDIKLDAFGFDFYFFPNFSNNNNFLYYSNFGSTNMMWIRNMTSLTPTPSDRGREKLGGIIDLKRGKLLFDYSRKSFGYKPVIAFSDDSQYFISITSTSSAGFQVWIHDLVNSNLVRSYSVNNRNRAYHLIDKLLIHASNEFVFTLSEGCIESYSIDEILESEPINWACGKINDMYFSKSGNSLVIVEDNNSREINISYLNKSKLEKEQVLYKFNSESLIEVQGTKVNKINKLTIKTDRVYRPIWPKHHSFHWQEQAEKGEPEALLQLGIIAQRDKRWDKAKEWYQKAKAAGHKNADYRLSINELMRKEYSQ